MPHFVIVLIPYINLLNFSWIKKRLFLRNMEPFRYIIGVNRYTMKMFWSQNGLNVHKGQEDINCTIVKYWEIFHRCHLADISAVVVKKKTELEFEPVVPGSAVRLTMSWRRP